MWTKPYLGVSHREGLPERWRITLTIYRRHARVYLVDRHSDHPFTPVEDDFGSIEEMYETGDRWAEEVLNAEG